MLISNSQYEVLTPNGWQDFSGIQQIVRDCCVHLIFDDQTELKCSLDHSFGSQQVRAQTLSVGDFLNGKKIIYAEIVEEPIELYDLLNVGGDHLYYTNGVVSHNCEFIGSTATLIAASALRSLAWKDPIWKNLDGLQVYEKPIEGHIYVMCVDTSRGVGLDYNAFTIIDITEMPYRIVAKYRNNKIAPLLFPNVIYPVAEKYNTAYVLVEINDIGGQVADLLHHDLEYDNLMMVSVRGRKGQCCDGGFGRGKTQFGIKTTAKVKHVGCSVLKSMIEEDKLLIEQIDIIEELCSFIKKGNTYQAEEGAHDDLVMTLVLFAWLSTQTYFKDLTNLDIRAKLYAEKIKQMEEDMLPAGFFGVTGTDAEVEIDSEGNVWTKVDDTEMQQRLGGGWSW